MSFSALFFALYRSLRHRFDLVQLFASNWVASRCALSGGKKVRRVSRRCIAGRWAFNFAILLAAGAFAAPTGQSGFCQELQRTNDGQPSDTAADSTLASDAFDSNPATRAFHALLADAWETTLKENPLFATRAGDHRFNDQLPSVSLTDIERRGNQARQQSQRLEQIARDELSIADQINYDMFARSLRNELQELRFKTHLIPITNRGGFHIDFPDVAKTTTLQTTDDFEAFIARLKGFRRYAEQHIDVMRAGIEQGYTLPSVVLEGYREPIETHIVTNPRDSVFFAPFNSLPKTVPAAEHDRLQAAAEQAIATSIVPGYQAFLQFMADEYVTSARGSIGAAALPEGRAYYRFCVQKYTTLPVTPEEVHQTGLSEVSRIRGEMEQIMRKVNFDGDFAAFLEHLRTDPQFYPQSAEELLEKTSYELKRMDGELPKLFHTLPRTPYGIRVIPAYIAPRTTAAYYMPPAGDGTQAGFYYINTYRLDSRPLYGVQALSLHEAVPGHHLQLALQQELTDLPTFRRFSGFTVFIEGWALYAERLGLEVGFYEDPYSDFGRLTYEIWRACRLVVDTGMHYLGWTRAQAIEFMEQNSGLSKHNIRAEVDRYIAWPGQALAYKMGELKIRELRQHAEDQLDDRFDIREFHDVVLRNGAIPLDILEQEVKRYIERTSAAEE